MEQQNMKKLSDKALIRLIITSVLGILQLSGRKIYIS